jgi:hypothetical protein
VVKVLKKKHRSWLLPACRLEKRLSNELVID